MSFPGGDNKPFNDVSILSPGPLTDSNIQPTPKKSSSRPKKSAKARRTSTSSSERRAVQQPVKTNILSVLETPKPLPSTSTSQDSEQTDMYQYNDVPEALTSALIRARSIFRPVVPETSTQEYFSSPGSINSLEEEKLPPKKRKSKKAVTPHRFEELEQEHEHVDLFVEEEQEEPLNLSKGSRTFDEEAEQDGPLDLSDQTKTPQRSRCSSVHSQSSWQRETFENFSSRFGEGSGLDRGRRTSGYVSNSPQDLRTLVSNDLEAEEHNEIVPDKFKHFPASEDVNYGIPVEHSAQNYQEYKEEPLEPAFDAFNTLERSDEAEYEDCDRKEGCPWVENVPYSARFPQPGTSVLRALLEDQVDAETVKNRPIPVMEEPIFEEQVPVEPSATFFVPDCSYEEPEEEPEQHFETEDAETFERSVLKCCGLSQGWYI